MKRKHSEYEEKNKLPMLSLGTVDIKDSESESDVSSDEENVETEEPKVDIKIKGPDNWESKQKTFITSPYLTKYEWASVVGKRAEHIANGAPVAIETFGETSVIEIAKMELRAKKLDLIIRRKLPGGRIEYRPVKDLIIMDSY